MAANMVRRGRKRNPKPQKRDNGNDIPPICAGQVNTKESEAVDKLVTRTGQSRSQITRRAIQRLLADDAAGVIDWGVGLDIEKQADAGKVQ
jgi:hypothetical protein